MSFKSDYGSEVDLNKFLKKILLSKNGEKFLLHQVNDDVGLVEAPNNDALTWLALSQSKIAWCMKDDDGEFEIQFYEPTIQGLDECIGEVYGRQDEINDLEKFKKEIISLSDEKLKVDKEVILAAVKQNGYALQYADEKLKANKEVILAAVKQDGNTLQYADKKLKANKEVVLAALKQEVSAHQYVDEKLKGDKDVVLAGKIDDDLLNDMAELLFKNFNSSEDLIIDTDIDIIDGEPIKESARIMMLREGLLNDSEYTVTIERAVQFESEDGDVEEDNETITSYSISVKNHKESIEEFESAIKTYIEYGGSKRSIV